MGTRFVPMGPPRPRRSSPIRRLTVGGLGVATVGLLALASTSLAGHNASSKFASVASAICATRAGPDRAARIVPGELTPPALRVTPSRDPSIAAVHTRLPSDLAACGGGLPADVNADVNADANANGRTGAVPGVGAPAKAASAAPTAPPASNAPAAATAAPSDTVPSLDNPAAGHAFISTATMTVTVAGADLVSQKKEEAIALVEGSGGALFGEETSFNGDARATVTLKIPPAKFRPALTSLAQLGVLVDQHVKTDDVTQQVIDLDARITAAQDGLDRMRGLLSKASDLNQVATLEADVNRREIELEQLKGEQQTLAQRVDLATIILTLTTVAPDAKGAAASGTTVPATTTTTTTAPKEARPLPGFGDGLENGWHVFTVAGTVVLACVGAVLPFAPFLLVALVVWRFVRRRRGSSASGGHEAPATAPATATATAPAPAG